MKKVLLTVALALGIGYPQTIASKLKGKRIYMMREVSGDHQAGYDAMNQLLTAGQAVYGYTFEYAPNALNQAEMDALYDRLYKPDGSRTPNTIDILIFNQGQGDCNVAGNPPFPAAASRMTKVNNHVKYGGGLIQVHAAGGREVSWFNWVFGAALMTDWFVDDYLASQVISGNGGHFSYGTPGTYTLDDETLPAKDSSTFFIRKILTQPKDQNGYGQPLVTDQVHGEWYHFNGGKKYEDGTGGLATNSNDKVQPKAVRGDPGVPDSGIGPARIVGILTKIGTGGSAYTPPGGRRHSVWVRDVSPGKYDAKAAGTNGRYALFNPGHGSDYKEANGWMGDFFFSVLRWVVKDDRGCTNPKATNFNNLATVDDGTCTGLVSLGGARLQDAETDLGRIAAGPQGLSISITQAGSHTVEVIDTKGVVRFRGTAAGVHDYTVPGLDHGLYSVRVTAAGKTLVKSISLL